MADTTDIDPANLRALARAFCAEEQHTAALTPAGALTTIGASVHGSLIAECHGAVALDILDFQEKIASRFEEEIDALARAACVIEDQEWATTAALGSVEPPR